MLRAAHRARVDYVVYDERGQIADIFITRNPFKLVRLDPILIQ